LRHRIAARLALSVLVSLAGALACSRAAPAPAGPKRTITIGVTQEPDTLLMQMQQMNVSEHIGRPGALLLTLYDDDWQLIPWAATRVPTVANGGVEVFIDDGGVERMRVTWTIADGFFWADGVPVTAHDFVLGHQVASDPRLEIVDRTSADRVLSMTAQTDKKLIVVWKERYAGYAALRVHEALPRHIIEPLWKSGADLKQHPFAHKPVLGGAFTIAEWVPGSHVRAVRNPFAVAKRPVLDEITWKLIPQSTGLESALLSGEIDAIGVVGLTFDQAIDFQTRHQDRFDVVMRPALLFEHIDVNLDHPALKERAVREALLLGADRQGVVDKLFGGRQPVADGLEPPGSPFHVADGPKRAFDPARADKLLEDAGWKRGADGVREKNDVRLRVPFLTTAGDKTRELVQQIFAANWRALGVDVVLESQPAKIMFGDTIRRRKFPGLAMFAWSKDLALIREVYWRCDEIPREENGWRGQNFPGMCNPEVDRLLREMARELDDAKRAEIGRAIERIMMTELPQLPLYFRAEISVAPKGFVGWKPNGLLQSMAWNAHEWAWSSPAASSATQGAPE
jgi:peptide/nickel transport system substrate-binding protein